MCSLRELVGSTDIYLIDQIVRGRARDGDRIFDAGCGSGRNLRWFLKNRFEVSGVDSDVSAITASRALAGAVAPGHPVDFRCETIEDSSFTAEAFDFVICSAVLHFARNHAHFEAMLEGAWRLIAPGGLFFCRLSSSIGMEPSRFRPVDDGGTFVLPDGSVRYLVDAARLEDLASRLGSTLTDPIRTTVVQDARCMTTWVLRRDG